MIQSSTSESRTVLQKLTDSVQEGKKQRHRIEQEALAAISTDVQAVAKSLCDSPEQIDSLIQKFNTFLTTQMEKAGSKAAGRVVSLEPDTLQPFIAASLQGVEKEAQKISAYTQQQISLILKNLRK